MDFGKHVVVFHRNVAFYTRTRIFKVTLRDGVAEVLAMETMSAMSFARRLSATSGVLIRFDVMTGRPYESAGIVSFAPQWTIT